MERNLAVDNEIIMIKFGGSLITDKDQPYTALPARIASLARQIKQFTQANPKTNLILGHGSGSFGHMTAAQHQTRKGVHSPAEWLGFADVWWDARRLNTLVLEQLKQEGLPVISFPISSSALTHDHQIQEWSLNPIRQSLSHQLIPVVFGDVVMDTEIGGTILSTEEIFFHLSPALQPTRIILLGIEPGVWSDFPSKSNILTSITPHNFKQMENVISGSASTDVTGGMIEKVKTMLDLISTLPHLSIQICDGIDETSLGRALNGERIGTRISN